MSVKPSMFVLGVIFDNSFIIRNLYELLPIVPVKNYEFTKGTIPFFGVNNCVVSVIPSLSGEGSNLKIRGARGNNGKRLACSKFGNAVTVDFQAFNKNFNIKMTSSKKDRSKFHMTGLKSVEMGKEVTKLLVDYINNTNDAWKPFFMLDFINKEKFLLSLIELLTFGDKTLLPTDQIVLERLKEKDYGELSKCVDLIMRFTYEDETKSELYERFNRIIYLNPGSYSLFHNQYELKVLMYDIYNGSYTCNINCELYIPFIAKEMRNLGFNVGFFNIGDQEFRIVIPIINEQHYSYDKKYNNIKGHLFIITLNGSIDLYSRGDPDEVYLIAEYVINTIKNIVKSDEYNLTLLGQITPLDNFIFYQKSHQGNNMNNEEEVF